MNNQILKSLTTINDYILLETILDSYSICFESKNDHNKMSELSHIVKNVINFLTDSIIGFYVSGKYRGCAFIDSDKLYGIDYGSQYNQKPTAHDLDIDPNVIKKLDLTSISIAYNPNMKAEAAYLKDKKMIIIILPSDLVEYATKNMNKSFTDKVNDDDWFYLLNKYRDQFRANLLHELIHSWDDKVFKREDSTYGLDLGDYYNHPSEMNAFIVQLIYESINKKISFNQFLNLNKIKEILAFYTPDNKKRALKRMHSLWDKFSHINTTTSEHKLSNIDEKDINIIASKILDKVDSYSLDLFMKKDINIMDNISTFDNVVLNIGKSLDIEYEPDINTLSIFVPKSYVLPQISDDGELVDTSDKLVILKENLINSLRKFKY